MTVTRTDTHILIYDGELPANVNISGLHRPACDQPDQDAMARAGARVYGDHIGRCTLAEGHAGDHDSGATWKPLALVVAGHGGTVVLNVGTATHGMQEIRLSPAAASALAGALTELATQT